MTLPTPQPFFRWPLQRLNEITRPAAISLRSLPDDRLQEETAQLTAICRERGNALAEEIMLRLYEAEHTRREDPAMGLDDDLDAALTRLQRQTSDADRQLVRDIGRRLLAIGGREAMTAAYMRMIERAKPEQQDLRRRIIAKRWDGIGAP